MIIIVDDVIDNAISKLINLIKSRPAYRHEKVVLLSNDIFKTSPTAEGVLSQGDFHYFDDEQIDPQTKQSSPIKHLILIGHGSPGAMGGYAAEQIAERLFSSMRNLRNERKIDIRKQLDEMYIFLCDLNYDDSAGVFFMSMPEKISHELALRNIDIPIRAITKKIMPFDPVYRKEIYLSPTEKSLQITAFNPANDENYFALLKNNFLLALKKLNLENLEDKTSEIYLTTKEEISLLEREEAQLLRNSMEILYDCDDPLVWTKENESCLFPANMLRYAQHINAHIDMLTLTIDCLQEGAKRPENKTIFELKETLKAIAQAFPSLKPHIENIFETPFGFDEKSHEEKMEMMKFCLGFGLILLDDIFEINVKKFLLYLDEALERNSARDILNILIYECIGKKNEWRERIEKINKAIKRKTENNPEENKEQSGTADSAFDKITFSAKLAMWKALEEGGNEVQSGRAGGKSASQSGKGVGKKQG